MNPSRVIAVLGLVFYPVCCLAVETPEAAARAFVEQCLKDPRVFVDNPMNPYKDLSHQERQQRQLAESDGAALALFRDGMPAQLRSRKQSREDGALKSWYSDGQLAADELFSEGKLVTGRYYFSSGALLSKIKDGTGTRITFSLNTYDCSTRIREFVAYRQGVRDGTAEVYWDVEKGIKQGESHYEAGQLHGPDVTWSRTGQKVAERHYEHGQEDGDQIEWNSTGQVVSLRIVDKGQLVEEGMCDPSGRLTLRVAYGGSLLKEAESYDEFGNRTGQVSDGSGTLIVRESPYSRSRLLKFYEKGRLVRSVIAPWPMLNQISKKGNDIHAEIQMRAPEEIGLDSAALHVLLPNEIQSPDELVFTAKDLKPEQLMVFGPFTLQMTNSSTQLLAWIEVEVEVALVGQKISYRTVLTPITLPQTPTALPMGTTAVPRRIPFGRGDQ